MLVRDRMTPNPTTVRPESDPLAAQTLLRYAKFHQLPVVSASGQLVGIVTSSDLDLFFSSAPSPGVVRRQYRIDQIMTSQLVTVAPDYPLEEAARLMLEHNVDGLPVVEAERLVGIITTSDILAQLFEALGGGTPTLRITVQVPDRPGQFAQVAAAIAALDCNICSLLSAPAGDRVNLTIRLQGVNCEQVVQAVDELEEIAVIHVWENPHL